MSWYPSVSLKKFSPGELRAIAENTIEICENGKYTNSKGEIIDISEHVQHSVETTVLFDPKHEYQLPTEKNGAGVIELTRESTLGCAYRLVTQENHSNTVMFNFANPVEIGGGWWRGAVAQEESIARSSSLVNSLSTDTAENFYRHNINMRSTPRRDFSSDYIIVTDKMPVFRDDNYDLLDSYFIASCITSPACYARGLNTRDEKVAQELHNVMLARIRKVIMGCAEKGYRALVLGAFGCGAFQNDINDIANSFKTVLIDEDIVHYFDKVVFAILSHDDEKHQVFSRVFNIPMPQ